MFGNCIKVRASGNQGNAGNLINGGMWNSGGFPPQWIEIDLGKVKSIPGLTIVCEQYPQSAATYHVIKAGESPNPGQIITLSDEVTHTSQVLRFSIGVRARYIRIETTKSPSWVAWKDLRIYADD